MKPKAFLQALHTTLSPQQGLIRQPAPEAGPEDSFSCVLSCPLPSPEPRAHFCFLTQVSETSLFGWLFRLVQGYRKYSGWIWEQGRLPGLLTSVDD